MFQTTTRSRSDWSQLCCSFDAFSAIAEEVSQICCWFYFLPTRKSLQSLLRLAVRMTVCMRHEMPGNARLLLNACFVVDQNSRIHWWCPWLCRNLGVLNCSSLNQASKSMAVIIGTCWWNNKCCQSRVALLETCLCSSKTARLHTMLVRLSSSCSSKHRGSSHQICGRPTARWTTESLNLGLDTEARVQDCSPRRQPAKTASHRHLVKSVSGRHRQRNRPVASAIIRACVKAKGRHFECLL